MVKSPKEEFIDLIYETNKLKGLDDLSSKIIAILFIETDEVSLDELSKRTGYSLSAVSTSMKLLFKSGFIKRIKKPKTKKIYFYMEKDLLESFLKLLCIRSKNIISISKEKIPKIIEKYELNKSKNSIDELKILKNYYKQLLVIEDVMNKFVNLLEEAHSKICDKK